MKVLIEILVSIVLHPVAVILAIINIAGRDDLTGVQKLLWVIVCVFAWGIGPILYVLAGGGQLW